VAIDVRRLVIGERRPAIGDVTGRLAIVTYPTRSDMSKERTTPEAAAAAFGVGRITRHLFVCGGPDCTTVEQGEATWDYIKRRMKELNLTGPNGPAYRTKCKCLRICTGGPIAVVYPDGAWYRDVTPEHAELIIQEHLIGGRIVERLCFARNPLYLAAEPGKL
jgi:(2Fe-2S) ferredoxin